MFDIEIDQSLLYLVYIVFLYTLIYSLIVVTFLTMFYKQFINTVSNNFSNFERYRIILLIIVIPVFVVSIPFFYTILSLCFLWKKCVETFLRVKYGSKFGGMLKGSDSFFAIDDVSKSIVNFLIIVNFDGKPTDFYNIVKKYVYKKIYLDAKSDPKLHSTREKCSGYYFILKNEYGIDECVSLMDNKYDNAEINEEEFQDILNDVACRSLPKNNSVFWEVAVGNKPVKLKNKDIKQYPVLIRIHHSLGDGVALIHWFVTSLTDRFVVESPHSQRLCVRPKTLYQKISKLFQNLFVFLIVPGFYVITFVKVSDRHVLHGPKLSGKKMLLCNIKDDDKQYLNMINDIKQNLPGTSSSHIMLTIFARSLSKHIKKYSSDISQNFYCLVTAALKFPNFQEYFSDHKTRLSGVKNFTYAGIFLPISVTGEDIIKSLNKVKEKTDIIKNSVVMQVNYLIANFSSVAPIFFAKYFSNRLMGTSIFSYLPSNLCEIASFNGLTFDDITVWTINRGKCGISVLITTYAGKLRLGLVVDEALIPNENDAKKVIDDLFIELECLHKKCVNSIKRTKQYNHF